MADGFTALQHNVAGVMRNQTFSASRGAPAVPLARSGLTLLEVSATLAVLGLAVLGADSWIGPSSSHRRLLAHMLRAVQAMPDDTSRAFRGTASAAVFETECLARRGIHGRCGVTLLVDRLLDSSRIIVQLPDTELQLFRVHGNASLHYRDDGAWTPRWPAARPAPRAIAVIAERDTLVFAIGRRHE